MKKIWIETEVKGNPKEILERFNEDLFRSLKPPGLNLEIMRFDGCKVGDHVHLNVGILGVTQRWHSEITECVIDERECYFTDVGTKLPAPFKTWKHIHRIRSNGHNRSLIIEDITFSCNATTLEILMKPLLEIQFRMRGPVYKKFFGSV